ncbi:MAG: hypothetical protein KF912_06235 [Phycisphaeraceae bacterium]|nr:hypothetical protein [Phycisphaeraceae bacterium]MBX3366898.1 hypothetical protein [Phycisphaeraceae bacterium]
MSWIEPTATALKLTYDVVSNRNALHATLLRTIHRLFHGPFILPLFGCGGVGKSTLGRILTSSSDNDTLQAYEESIYTEIYSLQGNVSGKVIAPPGQSGRTEMHWPGVAKALTDGESHCAINAVCHGYHSLGLPDITTHKLHRPGMRVEDFMALYTQDRRHAEIAHLHTLAELIPRVPRKLTLITLITKQDLWWNVKNDVRAHYESSEYMSPIEKLRSRLGAAHFQHVIIPVSFGIMNLTLGDASQLASTVSGYDQNIQSAHLNSFFKNLDIIMNEGRA